MKKFEYDDILVINKIICNREGQSSLVINESNIKSALSVQYSYYNTDEEIRTALFHHLIIAHGFEDGNKRTAVAVLLYDGNVDISDDELEKITLEIAGNNGSKYNIKELTNKIFGTNLIIENLNNDQLKAIRVIKHKYPYVNITAKNVSDGCTRIVIDSKEFNPNTAIEKINAIINDIDKLIGMNYRIKYEKPLKSTELNYPGYNLYRLVISLISYHQQPKKDEIEDIFYNNKTGYWELNGKEFVNYEDALKYV